MKWKRDHADIFLFAIARADDARYVADCLAADGQRIACEGNSSLLSLYTADHHRAVEAVSRSHRFRTGDLCIFILKHPEAFEKNMQADDRRAFEQWLGTHTK